MCVSPQGIAAIARDDEEQSSGTSPPREPQARTATSGRYAGGECGGLAAPCGGVQRWVVEGVVDRVDGDAWGDDLVDAVKHGVVEDDVRCGELALELLHGPRADDRRGDGGVVEHEGDRELDERDAGMLGELGELLDGVELSMVERLGEVEALGQPAGAR